MDVHAKLKELGFTSAPKPFYEKIKGWKSWYDGDVKSFHHYETFNGIESVDCKRYSVGMGKKVCEDWANLLMNEKVQITLEGEKEQEFVNKVFADNGFWVKANEMQERKAALGTCAYIPLLNNLSVRESTGEILDAGSISIDYCTAANIYPLSWDNGGIRECAFTAEKEVDGKQYLYMQLHRLYNGEYAIENHLYYADEEVSLASVRGFETVPEVIRTGSSKPQFVIDRLNIANTDENNPMGIAVFAHAIDQLKAVDIAFDGYVNEFVLGKKRIIVQSGAANQIGDRPVFDARETVYYVLPEDVGDKNILEQVDMTLRSQEFNAGIQDMLNVLASKCGFGESHYKYNQGSISTATQVISENSTLFRTIKKHEIILEKVLVDLCRIILRLGNSYMSAGLDEDVEISVDFDDSVIEDKGQNFQRDMQLLNAGIMNDWEFRMRWMNEDEATAKAALPKMQDMGLEGENETE